MITAGFPLPGEFVPVNLQISDADRFTALGQAGALPLPTEEPNERDGYVWKTAEMHDRVQKSRSGPTKAYAGARVQGDLSGHNVIADNITTFYSADTGQPLKQRRGQIEAPYDPISGGFRFFAGVSGDSEKRANGGATLFVQRRGNREHKRLMGIDPGTLPVRSTAPQSDARFNPKIGGSGDDDERMNTALYVEGKRRRNKMDFSVLRQNVRSDHNVTKIQEFATGGRYSAGDPFQGLWRSGVDALQTGRTHAMWQPGSFFAGDKRGAIQEINMHPETVEHVRASPGAFADATLHNTAATRLVGTETYHVQAFDQVIGHAAAGAVLQNEQGNENNVIKRVSDQVVKQTIENVISPKRIESYGGDRGYGGELSGRANVVIPSVIHTVRTSDDSEPFRIYNRSTDITPALEAARAEPADVVGIEKQFRKNSQIGWITHNKSPIEEHQNIRRMVPVQGEESAARPPKPAFSTRQVYREDYQFNPVNRQLAGTSINPFAN